MRVLQVGGARPCGLGGCGSVYARWVCVRMIEEGLGRVRGLVGVHMYWSSYSEG